MNRSLWLLAAAGLAAGGLIPLRNSLLRPPDPVSPGVDAVYTSTRTVTSLLAGPGGRLWVGTTGGILCREVDGRWRKFTRADGLPAHEARALFLRHGTVTATFPQQTAAWTGAHWEPGPPIPQLEAGPERRTCAATWRSLQWETTVAGLRAGDGRHWWAVPFPPSTGTHVSALLPRGDRLWVAVYGDGLWTFDGRGWRRPAPALPLQAREITALVECGDHRWAGTRGEGVWEGDGQRWTQHLYPGEPSAHDCQALTIEHGRLFASTLEDGLLTWSRSGWQRVAPAELSSNAPRQMVQFGERLYLRHGNGQVDAFGGNRWQRNVCALLPRKGVTALAADNRCLYAAQWGGWSEFNGRSWTHHLLCQELQDLTITALLPERQTLWIGTQRRGLAEVNRATGYVRWHDDRDGLPDDWLTALARAGDNLFAGTFVGGLARWSDRRWQALPELQGQNVTALAADADGALFIGTRSGVWRWRAGRLGPLAAPPGVLDPEVQALCPTGDGLWIGTRNGIFFRRPSSHS